MKNYKDNKYNFYRLKLLCIKYVNISNISKVNKIWIQSDNILLFLNMLYANTFLVKIGLVG